MVVKTMDTVHRTPPLLNGHVVVYIHGKGHDVTMIHVSTELVKMLVHVTTTPDCVRVRMSGWESVVSWSTCVME